jgi:hypothetical protein
MLHLVTTSNWWICRRQRNPINRAPTVEGEPCDPVAPQQSIVPMRVTKILPGIPRVGFWWVVRVDEVGGCPECRPSFESQRQMRPETRDVTMPCRY